MAPLARDKRQLDAFELGFGISLPIDYREFLLHTERDVRLGSYDLDGHVFAIAEVYGLETPEPIVDLAARRDALQGIVPAHLLAVARDAAGALLCVGVVGPRPGGVYLVRVPRARVTQVPPRMVAPSFSEFLDHLEPDADDTKPGEPRPGPRATRKIRRL